MTAVRAAVFRTPGLPLPIETVEMDAPRTTEVVVRVVASGVCHSDLHYLDGDNSLGVQLGEGGTVLGHEGAGIVEAVGDAVTYVQPGDRVIGCLSKFCGTCDQCLSGNPARCRVSYRIIREHRLSQGGRSITPFAGLGAFAERMLTEQNNLVKLPDDIPFTSASLLGCGVTTGLGSVFHSAKVTPGSTVAVIGCGGVGLSIIQGARIAGASVIVAIDTAESKRDLALLAGATHFINASQDDPVGATRATTGTGVDYAFEAVGHPALVRQALDCLDVGGLALVVGVQPAGTIYQIPSDAFYGEKRLQTCTMGSNRFRVDIPKWLRFYRQGRLELDAMVSRTRPLDEINEAFADMRAGSLVRTILVL